MVMRWIMVFVLAVVLTGCLKKASDENMSMEPAVTEEAATATMADANVSQGDTMQGKSVSVESTLGKSEAVEKPSIQDIQQALKNANLYEGKIDGIPGPATRKAVEAFQSEKGLKVDGKVGSKTWQKLEEYLKKNAN